MPVRPPADSPVGAKASGFQVDPGSPAAVPRPALHHSSQRRAALRPLHPENSPEATAISRELELLALLRSKYVVEVLGTQVQDGKLWCATEWLDAEDLETHLRKGHRFTTEEILHVAESIVHGLG